VEGGVRGGVIRGVRMGRSEVGVGEIVVAMVFEAAGAKGGLAHRRADTIHQILRMLEQGCHHSANLLRDCTLTFGHLVEFPLHGRFSLSVLSSKETCS